ncbi:DUF2971 domain-containing protein [Dyella sp.]|uniref:DUF2971 domain-containing protein n=1 Tax=Dyella sp. TaxID=1869338 RepID=UPI002B47D2C3|nr:DUF2971 domain-containing protein [Dyella sp.]HKT26560.1 DUF2971 domain-containing protein [Dyella sp.]
MDFHALFESTTHAAFKLLQEPTWAATNFCHYTSLQGAVGIVESQELWLSDHRFVNDMREYAYGKDLALNVIVEAAGTEVDPEFRGFLERLRESVKISSGRAIYIASMSRSPDKLDQWKGYGNSSESICIKFDADFALWNVGNSHPTHVRQQMVIYEEDVQVNLIRALIRIFKDKFDGYRTFSDPFLADLSYLIESQFILFKHPQYASEDELRLTIENASQTVENKKPRHRVAKGMVIPYITTKYISRDLQPPGNRLPIREIVVSPTSRADLLESVKVFVVNMGYPDVPVVGSSIKFRG